MIKDVPKKKRAKKESCRALEKKLDTLWSKYVRLSNMREDGTIECYTCGKPLSYHEAQCGHYMVRTHKSTRFHEMNTKPQCFVCNGPELGKQVAFRAHLVVDYGEESVQWLERHAYTECHRKPEWYHTEIDRIKPLVEVLERKMK